MSRNLSWFRKPTSTTASWRDPGAGKLRALGSITRAHDSNSATTPFPNSFPLHHRLIFKTPDLSGVMVLSKNKKATARKTTGATSRKKTGTTARKTAGMGLTARKTTGGTSTLVPLGSTGLQPKSLSLEPPDVPAPVALGERVVAGAGSSGVDLVRSLISCLGFCPYFFFSHSGVRFAAMGGRSLSNVPNAEESIVLVVFPDLRRSAMTWGLWSIIAPLVTGGVNGSLCVSFVQTCLADPDHLAGLVERWSALVSRRNEDFREGHKRPRLSFERRLPRNCRVHPRQPPIGGDPGKGTPHVPAGLLHVQPRRPQVLPLPGQHRLGRFGIPPAET